MTTSEQLEHEAEATRAQIASTLDQLRSRMTPGQMVDQLLDYTRDSGGGDFFRNFGRQVVGNPMPVALVGAGLAWLMAAGRGGRADQNGGGHRRTNNATDETAGGSIVGASEEVRDAVRTATADASGTVADLSERAARRAQDWTSRTRATAAQIGERVGDAASSFRETAGAAGTAASAAYDTVAERSRQGRDVMSRNARATSESAAAGGRHVLAFLQEQPLVLAGLGLALGAVLGAALPPTEAENRLMGDTSDAAKRGAKQFADEQIDKGKAIAEESLSAAKDEMTDQPRRQGDNTRAVRQGEEGTAVEQGHETTLVPSDQHKAVENEPDGGRHGTTEQTSR
jgi:hypothetical protein